jgi:hypothetical protein
MILSAPRWHRHGAHRTRLRGGRLPGWQSRRPAAGRSAGRKCRLHRAGSGLRRPVLQGCGQGHHPPPEGRGQTGAPVHPGPQLSVLRTHRHSAHLPRHRGVVREGRGYPRPLAANNATVHWMPEAIGEKRFGNWLREAKDWNISRNRFWGSCIPVWVSRTGIPSAWAPSRNWRRLSGQQVTDLHKHILDKIKSGATARCIAARPRCWTAGLKAGPCPMPRCTIRSRTRNGLRQNFPADFIAEGLDQTRGWFYTLMVLATTLFDKSSFRNVVVNGLVLGRRRPQDEQAAEELSRPRAGARTPTAPMPFACT